jgi:hypothetical protein
MNGPCLMVNGVLGLVWWLMGHWSWFGGKWGVGCGPANVSTWERGHSFLAPQPPDYYCQSGRRHKSRVSRPPFTSRLHCAAAAASCRPLLLPSSPAAAFPCCCRRLGALHCSLHGFDFPCCRLSLQRPPSPAVATAAGAFLLKVSPHRSLRRRPRRCSDAIDAPTTP